MSVDRDRAPDGTVWVCPACGKRSTDRILGDIDHGWDASCYSHAILCEADSIEHDTHGRIKRATAVNRDGWEGGRWKGLPS